VVQAYNPRTPEAEAGESWVWGQSELYNEILSQKKKKNL
jgi:hypothetical protein